MKIISFFLAKHNVFTVELLKQYSEICVSSRISAIPSGQFCQLKKIQINSLRAANNTINKHNITRSQAGRKTRLFAGSELCHLERRRKISRSVRQFAFDVSGIYVIFSSVYY